ncbi:MAG: cellulase family glycosylhydrolase [candidate division KSB1 bacterium]|nr:cellulase family glycosylhydrolase [candidate division KSB1 bacterium]
MKFISGLFLCLIVSVALLFAASNDSEFDHFVTAEGDQLYEGENVLRFVSFNVPNLLCIEDNMQFKSTNFWRLPNAFEIQDALNSVKQMGGQVVRTYTITVRRPDKDPEIPRHVEGPGEFNEEAFQALDQVLALANEIGIRVIIPFVDNWSWMGGKAEYAAFRGKQPQDFWTDPQIKQDFKETIRFMVNRKNTLTGIRYKNDKAILAWETGNELGGCPDAWTSEMAAYIKSQDSNHLVVEWTSEQPVAAGIH